MASELLFAHECIASYRWTLQVCKFNRVCRNVKLNNDDLRKVCCTSSHPLSSLFEARVFVPPGIEGKVSPLVVHIPVLR